MLWGLEPSLRFIKGFPQGVAVHLRDGRHADATASPPPLSGRHGRARGRGSLVRLNGMARAFSPHRKRRQRRIARLLLGLGTLAVTAVGLGFVLGLARPRKDVHGRPMNWRD